MVKEKLKKAREHVSKNLSFMQDKKFIYITVGILLLATVIFGFTLRTQNLPLLQDSTTGNAIPLALDPYYFLRVAELMTEGELPEYDSMRYPALKVPFTTEITPRAVLFLHKVMNSFGEISLAKVDILSPAIFFLLGAIAFFFLILVLTKSKLAALLGTFFLTIVPPFLYRTLSGFSDHEAIGIFAFFLAALCFALGMNELEKSPRRGIGKPLLFGLLAGIMGTFTIIAWGGVAKFIFMIFPLAFLLAWLIKFKKQHIFKEQKALRYISFYFSWIVSLFIGSLIFSYPISKLVKSFLFSHTALLTFLVLIFIIIDYLILKFAKKIKLLEKEKVSKYRVIISLALSFVLSVTFLTIAGIDILGFIWNISSTLLQPFGGGRIGSTVAENASPSLSDWMNQIGKLFFWIFVLGMAFIGVEFAKGIGKKKNKVGFSIVWILMILGILFSKISSASVLNGENFISKFVYFGSLLLFIGYFIWVYFNDKMEVNNNILFVASWTVFILLSGRGAIRMFFIIMPFIAFMVSYAVHQLIKYSIKSKDELLKTLFIFLTIILVIGLVISSVNFIKAVNYQAKNTGPSANYQWQGAMEWVRENTNEGDIFVHWWDYGYWVQYLGQRPTVTDGGHYNGYWDHLIGRYLLTSPDPAASLSFMKAHNVSYLLIDQTDLGKYGAYSRIGSGPEGNDRYSYIPVMVSDPSQIQETRNGTTIIYQGGSYLEEDLIYNHNGVELFFPGGGKTGVAGVIAQRNNEEEFVDARVVYIYNGQQTALPARYLYANGILKDFGKGLNVTIRILPKVSQSDQGVQMDPHGAAAYLSQKTQDSLFAKLYLMNDPLGEYPGVELVHQEQDSVVSSLNSQGANLGELVYFNGFRGPIKIWKVEHSDDILAREEFLRVSGEYAEFDDLEFTNY